MLALQGAAWQELLDHRPESLGQEHKAAPSVCQPDSLHAAAWHQLLCAGPRHQGSRMS